MKVEYLFSRNNKIGSKLISWAAKSEKLGLEDLPSHVAVLLNGNLVIESTLFTGVRLIPYEKWLEINTLVAKIPCDNLYRPSTEIFEHLCKFWGNKYDWFGIAYFSWCYIRLMLLGKELPTENKWERPDYYFCTEFIELLSGCECSMKSPAKLLSEWTTSN